MLVLSIVLVLALLLTTGWFIYQQLGRAREKAQAASEQDPCWVCGGESIHTVAEGIYECTHCGNVQGPHAQRYRNDQRRSAYVDLLSEREPSADAKA